MVGVCKFGLSDVYDVGTDLLRLGGAFGYGRCGRSGEVVCRLSSGNIHIQTELCSSFLLLHSQRLMIVGSLTALYPDVKHTILL
jgi:hypothetical protein